MLPLLRILLIEQDPATLKELSTTIAKVILILSGDDDIDIIECIELKQR